MRPIRHGVLRRSRATGSGPAATPMMRAASAPGNPLPDTRAQGRASEPAATPAARSHERRRAEPPVSSGTGGTLRGRQVRSRTANAAAFSQRAASDHAVMVNMRTLPRLAETTSSRSESAGRVWIVLPARLPRP
jgi:hypothetical protein